VEEGDTYTYDEHGVMRPTPPDSMR
jgi:hypothetical protein